ncbi:MAG: alanine racemase [Oscillospiraceae bacterium]|nr:alanine racemase [Oscillospiraceae bacterium]
MNKTEILSIAEKYGSPSFVFDLDILSDRMKEIKSIVGDDIALCYSIKANPFLIDAMTKLTDHLEVCSPGELNICIARNVDMKSIIFSGVNKTAEDVKKAVECNLGIYTAESMQHLNLLNNEAVSQGKNIPVLLRLTSGNQFGMDETILTQVVKDREQYSGVTIKGIHFFSGTQKKKTAENEKEINYILAFMEKVEAEAGFVFEKLEYGPGLPFPYFANEDFSDTLSPLKRAMPALKKAADKYELTIEMGRFYASSCGYYLTSIVDIKTNKDVNYCIIDGGINHVNYYGQTLAMKLPIISHFPEKTGEMKEWAICGSLCTAADLLVRKYPFTDLAIGDLLVFENIGAYSITEGIYLFLSRRMPRVILYSKGTGAVLVRDFYNSDILNTIQE